jgi:alpha-tubulin suppressor-like RCC1 family protein
MRLLLPFIALGLAMGACTAFPDEPAREITVQPLGWTTLAVTDVETLAVSVPSLNGSMPITGLGVKWQSSNDALLTVVQLQPPDGATREEKLVAQLRAVATAHAGGLATVSVFIEGGGAFEADTVSDTIRVTQKWVSVSAGSEHSCGVTVDDNVFCWGSGLLGNGSALGSPIPVQVIGTLAFSSVTAGEGHSCGALTDGRVYCWGLNLDGAIGNSFPDDQLAPVPVSLGRTFGSVTAGQRYVCGVTTESTGFCWGDNVAWQLGDAGLVGPGPFPSFDDCGFVTPNLCSLRPRPVEDRFRQPLNLLSLAPGVRHTCAVLATHDAVCWGSGSLELGSNSFITTDSTVAEPIVAVPGGVHFESVSTGLSHSCGVTSPPDRIYCWGFNSVGQLGTQGGGSPAPLQVSGPAVSYRSVEAGDQATCGITSDSTAALCWGSNQFGQLGTTQGPEMCGGVSCSPTPVRLQLLGDPKIVSVSLGAKHGCAVTAPGALYCWGEALGGKLGNDSLPNSTVLVSPVRISEPR